MKCSRCRRHGHLARDCPNLGFLCTTTAAQRNAAAAQRRAEWEAKQAEREAKQAEWEAKQAEWNAKQTERQAREAEWAARRGSQPAEKDFDVESNVTDASTAVTTAAARVDEAEVELMAMTDKEVRKFMKVLRDILKLEGRSDLDALQKAKVARKAEVEKALYEAKVLAKFRAREQMRRQAW